MLSSDERFEGLSNLLGSGNLSGGIWFIGLEPGGGWNSESSIDTFLENLGGRQYDWCAAGDSQVEEWRISPVISKICHQITRNDGTWRDYRRSCYQTKDGDFFASNLYPIARPSPSDTPSTYKAWLGYTDEQAYGQRVQRSGRFAKIRTLREESDPKITICHGIEKWSSYKDILGLGSPISELEDGKIVEYSGGVFLTPHLSRATHMPDSRIEKLVALARNYW